MKKRLLAVLLSCAVILSLSGCAVAEQNGTPSGSENGINGAPPGGDSGTSGAGGTSGTGVTASTPDSATITEARAKEIALADAAVGEAEISRYKIELDRDDGVLHYDIEFFVGAREYDYEINAQSGAIISKEIDGKDVAVSTDVPPTANISEAAAKQKALSHAGLNENAITQYKIELDNDADEIPHYDIEFKSGGYEYDYEINLKTGEVMKSEKEIDD